MQNEAFAEVGADYAYLAFEVGADEIEDAVKAIRTLKMRGSNVSMPNKTLVGQYLDELDPAAELCGAVNTIVNDNGHLKGYITDGIGFMAAIKDNDIDPIDTVKKINENTNCKAKMFDLADTEALRREMADSYLFVNATGAGMKPLEDVSVVPDKSFFRPELIVVDVPYGCLLTKMRKMAKEVGCKTMNGLGMMLFQGAAGFELWTGKPMPIEHMKEVLGISYDD